MYGIVRRVLDPGPVVRVGSGYQNKVGGSGLNIKIQNPSKIKLFFQSLLQSYYKDPGYYFINNIDFTSKGNGKG